MVIIDSLLEVRKHVEEINLDRRRVVVASGRRVSIGYDAWLAALVGIDATRRLRGVEHVISCSVAEPRERFGKCVD